MEKPYRIRQIYFDADFSTLYIELHTVTTETQQWKIKLLDTGNKRDCIQIRNIGGTSEKSRQNTFKFVEKAGYWEDYHHSDKALTFVVNLHLGDLRYQEWNETIILHCGKYLNNQCHL